MTSSMYCWYDATNAQRSFIHLGFSTDEVRDALPRIFFDVNQQVVWHQYCYLFLGFTSGFRKEKETIPFQCSISSQPYGKQGFIPANSLSLKTWRKSASHCYSRHQPWYRCLENAKIEKWNKKKTLKNKLCISEK